jgi:hypothetical protein
VPFKYTKEQVEKLKSLKQSDSRLRAHWPRCRNILISILLLLLPAVHAAHALTTDCDQLAGCAFDLHQRASVSDKLNFLANPGLLGSPLPLLTKPMHLLLLLLLLLLWALCLLPTDCDQLDGCALHIHQRANGEIEGPKE